MPDFPIVDTHVHFWDRGVVPVSWMENEPSIHRPFLPADLDADRDGVEIEALVFVEAAVDPGMHLRETEWVASLAAQDRRIQAIVAHAPLEIGEAVAADLERLAAEPLVRGIRRLIQTDDAEALCGSDDFRAALKLLPGFDLHFELCLLHHQFAPVLDLVRANPEVFFVLDHIAKPGIKACVSEPWSGQIAELAALGNVVCKISGVATEADHDAWSETQLRPYIDHSLDLFGPERVLFGSDWPVMRLALAYPRWIEIVDGAVANWSQEDRQRLYSGNAKRVYRLR